MPHINATGGPLGKGCPANVEDCSPAYLCLSCCRDLASGVYLADPDADPDVDLDGAEYEFRCFGTITCDPLTDRHGRECERLNNEARHDFYVDEVAPALARELL